MPAESQDSFPLSPEMVAPNLPILHAPGICRPICLPGLAWPCADRDTTLHPCSWEPEVKRTQGAGLWFRDWPSREALAGLPGSPLTCSLIWAQRQPGCLPHTSLPSGQGPSCSGHH